MIPASCGAAIGSHDIDNGAYTELPIVEKRNRETDNSKNVIAKKYSSGKCVIRTRIVFIDRSIFVLFIRSLVSFKITIILYGY